MKYRVIKKFTDLQDNNYVYDPKDPSKNTYPREGYTPSEKRIAELTSNKNRQGVPLIEVPASAVVDADEAAVEESKETEETKETEGKPRKRKAEKE